MQHISPLLAFTALFAPLASFITICCTPRAFQKIFSSLSVGWILLSTVSAAVLLFTLWNEDQVVIPIEWFTAGTNLFTADLILSNYSMLMLAVVSFISLLVHIYSISYMHGDSEGKRYFAMLGFFTFSMQGIVLADNLLILFIFWELVGFSSYLLIGHWTKKPEAGRAATKAFIMNRIGDAGFVIGLMILWAAHGTFSVSEINAAPVQSWQTAASLCIFLGVVGKSAQFPLFTWLPDAMEGPTPVSALIHAATMVAAGVYLLVRMFGLFTEDALLVVAVTGMVTTLIGALAALSQYDLKKILAYSTMSQLGLMILALGMGIADAALLHLLTHAFFKACLFLSAGVIIHSLQEAKPAHMHFDVQDIRHMGGMRKALPVVFVTFLVSGASLAGVPFFSGFLSKEAILTALFMHTHSISWLMLVIILTVSFLTVLYTFRMIWYIFFTEARTIQPLELKKPSPVMVIPVILLAACSLWLLVSWNPFDFQGWMLRSENTSSYSLWITLFSTFWVGAALMVSWYLFRRNTFRANSVLRNGFYVDKFYSIVFGNTIRRTTLALAHVERNWIDKSIDTAAYTQLILAHVVGWVDRVFVDGSVNALARLTGWGGRITRSFQGGNIQLYIFWAVFAIIIFLISTIN